MKKLLMITMALILVMAFKPARADIERYRSGENYAKYIRYDRYLDVEVWTDDDRYYDGENLTVSFRANKDCYVVIYNIDTQGRVHLLYPSDRWDDMKIERDRIYRIPDSYDDYDLTVRGPEGMEYVQIVASMTPLPIPDWRDGSGLVAYEDPLDYLDYINASVFCGDPGTAIALDLAVFTVEDWQPAYFRPVYTYHHYYDWDWCGMIYVDYPWGATVYIDGIYWGVAPLFIPRIYYGWHYVTIYDRYGYCWEDRVNVYRRKAIVLDDGIIKTRSGTKSRYREVRQKGYLDPAGNGYPDYDKKVRVKKEAMQALKSSRVDESGLVRNRDPRSRESAIKYNPKGTDEVRSRTQERRELRTPDSGNRYENENEKRSAVRSRTNERATEKLNDSRSSESRDRNRRSYDEPDRGSNRSSGSTESRSKVRSRPSGGSSGSGSYKRPSSSSGRSGVSRSSGSSDRGSRSSTSKRK